MATFKFNPVLSEHRVLGLLENIIFLPLCEGVSAFLSVFRTRASAAEMRPCLCAESQLRPSSDDVEAASASKPGPCWPNLLDQAGVVGLHRIAAASRWGLRFLQEAQGEHLPRQGSVLVLGTLGTGVVSQSGGDNQCYHHLPPQSGCEGGIHRLWFSGEGLPSLVELQGQPALVGQGPCGCGLGAPEPRHCRGRAPAESRVSETVQFHTTF